MGFRLKKSDLELLRLLADGRVWTTTQLAHSCFERMKSARRRLAQLVEAGMIVERPRTSGRSPSPGRAENVYSLAPGGFNRLREEGTLPAAARFEDVDADRLPRVEHELLLNWFWLHLRQVENTLLRLTCRHVSSASIFAPVDQRGIPLLHFWIPASEFGGGESGDEATAGRGRDSKDCINTRDGDADAMRFTPDGAFCVTDREQGKSALFFVEVDMGTEPLSSSERSVTSIQQKVINYQALFASGRYKVFSTVWNHDFNGFRLLFLVNTADRMASLCRLVQEMKPSDFIWVTDEERLFAQGLADCIWARGGRLSPQPPESILNWSLARPSPLPAMPV